MKLEDYSTKSTSEGLYKTTRQLLGRNLSAQCLLPFQDGPVQSVQWPETPHPRQAEDHRGRAARGGGTAGSAANARSGAGSAAAAAGWNWGSAAGSGQGQAI